MIPSLDIDLTIKIDSILVPDDIYKGTANMPLEKQSGLEGVVAAATRLSRVDGEAGNLILAGYAVEEIAPRASFEEMAHLLWYGNLPNARELKDMAVDPHHEDTCQRPRWRDRKSTRLNSSHSGESRMPSSA